MLSKVDRNVVNSFGYVMQSLTKVDVVCDVSSHLRIASLICCVTVPLMNLVTYEIYFNNTIIYHNLFYQSCDLFTTYFINPKIYHNFYYAFVSIKTYLVNLVNSL